LKNLTGEKLGKFYEGTLMELTENQMPFFSPENLDDILTLQIIFQPEIFSTNSF